MAYKIKKRARKRRIWFWGGKKTYKVKPHIRKRRGRRYRVKAHKRRRPFLALV